MHGPLFSCMNIFVSGFSFDRSSKEPRHLHLCVSQEFGIDEDCYKERYHKVGVSRFASAFVTLQSLFDKKDAPRRRYSGNQHKHSFTKPNNTILNLLNKCNIEGFRCVSFRVL